MKTLLCTTFKMLIKQAQALQSKTYQTVSLEADQACFTKTEVGIRAIELSSTVNEKLNCNKHAAVWVLRTKFYGKFVLEIFPHLEKCPLVKPKATSL